MARFLRNKPWLLSLLKPSPSSPPSRSFLSEPHLSTFDSNLLRILRSEIACLADYRPPHPPVSSFKSFAVEDHPGEQWIRLRSKHGADDIKVDATMFDGAAPVPEAPLFKKVEAYEKGLRLHISLVVEVSRGEESDSVLEFICSAWPDSLVVQKVFPLRRKGMAVTPYMGRDFRELEEGLRKSVQEYLEERGVDDELAEFLHEYMLNKDKAELLRWLMIVESYVQRG
ncbi:uncharacterized protein At2g39795, mitochondrial-like [Typha latifolia]|uniref:uncharacterized protein At2g39795, mitochondrial-like n=1 Tax=Typha latifolia TaxID=4733 RepID=UPI003C2F9E03